MGRERDWTVGYSERELILHMCPKVPLIIGLYPAKSFQEGPLEMPEELTISTEKKQARLEWIEPQVRQLDVAETAFQKGMENDGETQYADCTLS